MKKSPPTKNDRATPGSPWGHLARPRAAIRRPQPIWPFYWRGLALVSLLLGLCLYALTAFAVNRESQTEEAVERVLEARGARDVRVEVDGQVVRLSGTLPAGARQRDVERWVLSTTCPTAFGDLICPTRADAGQMIQPAALEPVVLEPIVLHQPPAAPWPPVEILRGPGGLRLRGQAPSPALKNALLRHAEGLVGAVRDELAVRQSDVDPKWSSANRWAIDATIGCHSARAALVDRVLAYSCLAPESRLPVQRATASTPPDGLTVGSVTVAAVEQTQDCQNQLTELLSTSRVLFENASAQPSESSLGLLDRVAVVLKACPGAIAVTGHTDAHGPRQENLALSLERSRSVALALGERGVLASRLRARGRGPDAPIASNESAHGRAANRRIELSLIPPHLLNPE